FYFTQDGEKVGKDYKLADGERLVLALAPGDTEVSFTKGGVDRRTVTASAQSRGVIIGPDEDGGISVTWVPSEVVTVDHEADDWHVRGAVITKGGNFKRGQDVKALDPPVPPGANDLHGKMSEPEKKSLKVLPRSGSLRKFLSVPL